MRTVVYGEVSEFDGQQLLDLLAELDDELSLEGLSEACRTAIVGGAAAALHVPIQMPVRVTVDVRRRHERSSHELHR